MNGYKPKMTLNPGDPTFSSHIVLCIKVRNEGWCEVDSEKILDYSEVTHQAEQLQNKYFLKLKNQFFHLKTPIPRAIRCSAIDEMAVVFR